METQTIENEIKQIKADIIQAIAAKADAATVVQMQNQLDALDVKLAERYVAANPPQGLETLLNENDQIQRIMRDKKGVAYITLPANIFERKTTITQTAVGSATSGVLLPERIPGITPEARQRLMVEDLLTSRTTTMSFVDFVKVNVPMLIASPQIEASDKGENAVTFTTGSEKVQTIATWIPASRQVLDDMGELMGFLQTALPYQVNLEVERELLSGDGTGANLHGLIPQASSFDISLLIPSAGYTKIDIISAAIQQIQESKEIDPTFAVLNPRDWWALRRSKDSYGRYLMGDPATVGKPRLWDLDIVVTNNLGRGTFLVGSGDPVATEIRNRMEIQLEIATQHASFFSSNLIALRCESRLALITKRPHSFIYASSFVTSP